MVCGFQIPLSNGISLYCRCLEMAIYNNVTGALVCSQKPIYGGTSRGRYLPLRAHLYLSTLTDASDHSCD
jgi:hypothetical protein